MSAQIDKTQSSSLSALIPKTGVEQLPAPHRTLITKIKAHIAGESSSLDTGDLALLRQTFAANRGLEPPLSIRDLPVEVAQAILDAQAKTMEEFFRSWAESIEKNAKADEEASERAQRQKEELDRPHDMRRQKLIFTTTLNRLVQTNQISPTVAADLARAAGLAGTLPSPPLTPRGWSVVSRRDLQASMLVLPRGKTGVPT
ncbi:MAG: hypothetical protein V3T05_02345 [Myxococcota bacterium]